MNVNRGAVSVPVTLWLTDENASAESSKLFTCNTQMNQTPNNDAKIFRHNICALSLNFVGILIKMCSEVRAPTRGKMSRKAHEHELDV